MTPVFTCFTFHVLFWTMLSATSLFQIAYAAVNPGQGCLKGNGSFSACEAFKSTSSECATLGNEEFGSCFCNQGYLNAIVGCMNENRECFQNTANDRTALSRLATWRRICSAPALETLLPATYNVSTITTPPAYSITRYIPPAGCDLVNLDCREEIRWLRSCSSYYIAPLRNDPNFCLCQPREVQLASRCTFDANISCFGREAQMTNLDVYKSCDLSLVTPWFAMASATPTPGWNGTRGAVATKWVITTSYETVMAKPTATMNVGKGGSSSDAAELPLIGFSLIASFTVGVIGSVFFLTC